MVPPLSALAVHVTVRPPDEPVLLSKIPLAGLPLAAPASQLEPPVLPLPAEMHWKLSPLAPIVVAVTVRAVPLVVFSVLPKPVTLAVPPPVAVKAGFVPVLIVRPPE